MMSPLQAMRDLLDEDTRYKFEAYQFIRESLQFAQENMDLTGAVPVSDVAAYPGVPAPRHVTGQQLCHACRLYALQQYGFLAPMVLEQWGIRSTSDLGELVYNLIRIEQMKKSDTDKREDFNDVYPFDEAFEPEFEFSPRDQDDA